MATLAHCEAVKDSLALLGPQTAQTLRRSCGNGMSLRDVSSACWALLEADEIDADRDAAPILWIPKESTDTLQP